MKVVNVRGESVKENSGAVPEFKYSKHFLNINLIQAWMEKACDSGLDGKSVRSHVPAHVILKGQVWYVALLKQ